jgi:hypothetical protein
MASSFIDACRFNPTAGGTTDWTYSSALTGYQSPTAAGATNGATYSYRAESADLTQWEIGTGAYNSGTGVFARTAVLFNSSGTTSKINFSAAPQVAIVALAEDLRQLAINSAVLSTQPANPTGTTSASPLMMGLGSSCKITPVYSSRVEVEFLGLTSNTNAVTPNGVRVAWGTGAAPANGAAASGTTFGSILTPTVITASTNQFFKNGGIITGLTPGVQIWFDIQLNAGGGTATLTALTCNAKEVL